MEPWQKVCIRRNRTALQKVTHCGNTVLSYLLEKEVISQEDKERLETRGANEGKTAQAALFYDIIVTKDGAYPILIQAFDYARQTYASKILKEGEKNKYLYSNEEVPAPPPEINDVLPNQINYYIPRKLFTRSVLTDKIFELSKDIFLFTGMEPYQLKMRLKNGQTGNTTDQLDNRDKDVRYMILDKQSHFDNPIKLNILRNKQSTTSVHHIKFEGDQLHWVKSRGSIDRLQRIVAKPQSQQHLTETEFLDKICQSSKTNMPVCISDSPGMGKSVILLQIGGDLKKRFPERTIIFQEFANLIDSYKTQQKSIEMVLKTLTCKDNKLGESIFTSKLGSKDLTLELLLDGYDELSPASFQTAKEILETLRSKFPSIRVWMTTRPHLLEGLENILHVFGFNIEPFTHEDQVKFLASYWSRPDNDQAVPIPLSTAQQSRLTDYAAHCLNYIKSALPSKDQDIAGIPLQCRMIGEVYENEALEHSQDDSSFSGIKILISSITDLYERTITNRLRKYQSAKYTKLKLGVDDLQNMHAYLGIQLVFPEHLATLKPHFRDVEPGDIFNVGILESVGSKCEAKFVHRTFAEYFIAWFAVHALSSADSSGGILESNLQNLLLNGILKCKRKEAPYNYEFEYPVVCFFLNALLQLNKKESESISPTGRNFPAIAWACAYNDFPKIFKLLDRWTVFKNQEEEIFNSDFLLTTVQKSNLELIKIAVARLGREKWDLGLQTKVLRSAVERGVFNNVAFLLQHNDTYKILEEGPSRERMQILHCCVENSKDDTDETIREKVQVLRHLVNINKELLEEKDENQNTPLIVNGIVHPELVKTLISLGADVLAKTKHKDTILHFTYFTTIEYHSILTTLQTQTVQKEKLTELVNSVGFYDYTPLRMLIETMGPAQGTLSVFKSAGADFNFGKSFMEKSIDYDYSLLDLADKMGRNIATIKELISCGADVNWKGQEGGSYLHVAAKHLRLEVVSMLIDEGCDINVRDKELRTPLHWAAGNADKADKVSFVKSLIQFGADVNGKDNRGNLFLHDLLLNFVSLTSAQLSDIAEFLVANHNSKCFETENNAGVTPLQLALERLNVEERTLSLLHENGVNFKGLSLALAIKGGSGTNSLLFLIDHGADLTWKNENDGNLLHLACQHHNLEAIHVLMRRNFDVHSKDKYSRTPLHYAGKERFIKNLEQQWKTIKTLIDTFGADVNEKDDNGDTFLHLLFKNYSIRSLDFVDKMIELLATKQHSNLFCSQNKKGATPLHILVEQYYVTEKTLSLLHSKPGVRFDSVDNEGDSVLAHAIRRGRNAEFLSTLVKCGADVNHRNNSQQNLLHIAAKEVNLEAIKFGIENGVDVNAVDNNGNTPLHLLLLDKEGWRPEEVPHMASLRWPLKPGCRLEKVASLLFENEAEVDIKNKKGKTSFELAQQKYFPKYPIPQLEKIFFERMRRSINKQDEEGNTKLHRAVIQNDDEQVQQLLLTFKADVNVRNKKLQTCLHIAASREDKVAGFETIKFLIDNKAAPHLKDDSNNSFLHILLGYNSNFTSDQFQDVVQYLLQKDWSQLFQIPGGSDAHTPFMLALLNLELTLDTLNRLCPKLDMYLADQNGNSNLAYAIRGKRNTSLLPNLIQQGSDLNCLNNTGSNLLHVAVEYGNTDAVRFLLDKGLNINGANSYGNTPLHVAFLLGRENVAEISKLLIQRGADSNIRNSSGHTPLLILVEKPHFNLLQSGSSNS